MVPYSGAFFFHTPSLPARSSVSPSPPLPYWQRECGRGAGRSQRAKRMVFPHRQERALYPGREVQGVATQRAVRGWKIQQRGLKRPLCMHVSGTCQVRPFEGQEVTAGLGNSSDCSILVKEKGRNTKNRHACR